MSRPIRLWPSDAVVPRAVSFVAPQNTGSTQISRSGFLNTVPVAGSRNTMHMEFSARSDKHAALYNWLLNNANSAYFQIDIWNIPTLASSPEITAAKALYSNGIPFSTGQPFSTGNGWKFVPTADIETDGEKGDVSLTIDLARWPNSLTFGSVFGIGRSTHHIDNIEYTGNTAEIEFRPPLRKAVLGGVDLVSLRPKFVGQIENPESFRALFQPSGYFTPGSVKLIEIIDADIL